MDYEMVAAVIGNGEVEIDAMEALLDWFLPDEVLLELGQPDQGVDIIRQWCIEVDQEYVDISSAHVVESLANWQDRDIEVVLIVLGIEDNEETIQQAWNYGIEVADLTRALYIVQQGVDLDWELYEPVTHPHEVTDGLGGRGSLDIFASQNGLQSDVRTSIPSVPLWQANAHTAWTREQLEEMMTGLIRVHEEGFHPSAGILLSMAEPSEEELNARGIHNDGIDDPSVDKIRCLKNTKTGAIKISPRAKPKNGEEEIWLTQDEIDAVSS